MRELWHLQLIFFLTGLTSSGSGMVAFSKAIGLRVTAIRGRALGIVLSGSGMAGFIAPLLAQAVVEAGADWKGICQLIGVAVFAVGIPIVIWGVSPMRVAAGPSVGAGDAASGGAGKLSFLDRRFLVLFGAILIFGTFVTGLVIVTVPMLRFYGMEAARAAQIGSLFGAEGDVLSILIIRHFGLHEYGRIYGTIYGGFALTGIASPILIAALVTTQGYAMLNLIAAAGFTVSAVMILSMPRTKAA